MTVRATRQEVLDAFHDEDGFIVGVRLAAQRLGCCSTVARKLRDREGIPPGKSGRHRGTWTAERLRPIFEGGHSPAETRRLLGGVSRQFVHILRRRWEREGGALNPKRTMRKTCAFCEREEAEELDIWREFRRR